MRGSKYIIFFSILSTFSSVSNAQNYSIDFDGSNDHISTTIDADLQAMPSTTWSSNKTKWTYWLANQLETWKMVVGIVFL